MTRIWPMWLSVIGGCLVAAAAVAPAAAAYPDKPIRIIVTFPPGGSSDAMIRLIAPRLSERLGQQVIVDNRAGAGGNIGLALVAKAEPDGYTLDLGAAGALSANASLYAQMPFDALKDFKPIVLMASVPFVLVGSPSLGAQTQRELIASARKEPGKLSVGHGGNGTGMHLTAALFSQMADIKWVEVPYRGTSPATADVLAGQLPLAVSDLPASLQLIRAGKLRAYAVTSAKRQPALPEVPTIAEAGLPGFESTGWFGLVAPAGTPAEVIGKINAEVNAALQDAAIAAGLRALGVDAGGGTPQAFESYIRSETRKWAQVIKAAGIKLE
jgi:tripartite-type tricarboxylate transporter receptor subunit TctC